MCASGKTERSPFSALMMTSPRIEPGAAEAFWGKQRIRSSTVDKTISAALRMTIASSDEMSAMRRPNGEQANADCLQPLRICVLKGLTRKIRDAQPKMAQHAGI